MTRTDAIGWCQSKLGQSLDYDGQYSAQCVDFFNFYYKYITGRNPYADGFGVPGAKDLWNVRVGHFDYIQNNPNDYNQLPEPGDIMIYSGSMPGTGGYGHVAIVGEAKNVYYDQNYGGMYVKRNTRAFNGYELGWMRYKGFNQGDTPMTPQEEATAYQIVLGRPMEHGGSGRTGYKFITDAQAEVAAQRQAQQNAVADLRNQLVSVQSALANEQAKPPKEVIKEVEKIVEKIVEVEKPIYTYDQETKENVSKILTMVTSIFDYFRGQYKSFAKYIKRG